MQPNPESQWNCHLLPQLARTIKHCMKRAVSNSILPLLHYVAVPKRLLLHHVEVREPRRPPHPLIWGKPPRCGLSPLLYILHLFHLNHWCKSTWTQDSGLSLFCHPTPHPAFLLLYCTSISRSKVHQCTWENSSLPAGTLAAHCLPVARIAFVIAIRWIVLVEH